MIYYIDIHAFLLEYMQEIVKVKSSAEYKENIFKSTLITTIKLGQDPLLP